VRIPKQLILCLLLFCPALSLGEARKIGNDAKPQVQLTGMWRGVYSYPDGTGQNPVNFQMALVQDGATVVGFIKEPNTFGKRQEPWLHAVFKGRFEEGKLTFTKTYDGTAGENHDVEYSSEPSKDRAKFEGRWTIGNFAGRFTLEKLRLDEKTLESLKTGPSNN
jgi:hypothetical protein